MSNLKRATPWMITISFLLVCYIAAYYWLYKARYGYHGIGSGGVVHVVFRPLAHWDHSRMVKKRQREARDFCQGKWQGKGTFRDADLKHHKVTFEVTIDGDNLTITSADHDTVLVGKTWKIQSFDHSSKMQKDDYAPRKTPELKAFSAPALMPSPGHMTLPWFPFHDCVPPGTYITGKHVYLHRVVP
jgi:hypothetical protein